VDLGDPVSYLGLEEGTPVFASDGREIGRVGRVVADEAGGQRFADGDDIVLAMHERGVVLTVDADGARQLPEPGDR